MYIYIHMYVCMYVSLGRGDDTVGNPHRAQISRFRLFELVLSSKFDKWFPFALSIILYINIYIYIYNIYIYIYISLFKAMFYSSCLSSAPEAPSAGSAPSPPTKLIELFFVLPKSCVLFRFINWGGLFTGGGDYYYHYPPAPPCQRPRERTEPLKILNPKTKTLKPPCKNLNPKP